MFNAAHTQPDDARTERRNRGRHREKLRDTGARVARVAHELNAPLGLIAGSLENLDHYVGVLLSYAAAAEKHRGHDAELARLHTASDLSYVIQNAPTLLKICRDGAVRLHHVVQQLRGYTRRTAASGSNETVDLAAIIDGAITLAAHARDVLPVIRRDVPAGLRVRGVAESIGQAFVNVIANALDAVDGRPDPQVWIHARVGDAPTQHSHPTDVEVRIGDNGPGIQSANRARIFEPFFTTKPGGSGLGLGLAITREIVESQGGTIALATPSGSDAEFLIHLPIGGDA